MASLIITEFRRGAIDAAGQPQPIGRPHRTHAVTIDVASAQSAALAPGTAFVRLFAEAKCYVAFGADPTTATTSDMPLGTEQREYFGAVAGQVVATIQRA